MIELGKYTIYIISAYGVTLLIILILTGHTLIDFIKTKKKLIEISKKNL